MKANIDIKALAKEISKKHSLNVILRECERLVGECEPDIEEYYTIEDGIEDGFLGYDEWYLDIRITPEVEYYLIGGYSGCDLSDCDHVVDSIRGIDYLEAYSVAFSDEEGNEYELDEKQLEELQNELEDAIYGA